VHFDEADCLLDELCPLLRIVDESGVGIRAGVGPAAQGQDNLGLVVAVTGSCLDSVVES
jgi:hypothetical protein